MYQSSQYLAFIILDFSLILARLYDEVAEWLRRWTANPLGSARVGSNPILVELFYFSVFIFF